MKNIIYSSERVGKNYFLKLLMGILKPLDGDIVVDKLNITSNFEKVIIILAI